MVRADSNSIQQALMNLVVNARDAMPRGGTLEIQTTNVRLSAALLERHLEIPAGDYIVMAVNDNGAGMDETTQNHLFEPFYTTKPLGAGTGLGLATVHRVVEQSGGWISISSERGRGTSVKIYLPRVDGELAQAGMSPRTVPEGGHETILVVEDSAEVRRFIRIALLRLGYKVLEAASAEQAVAACRKSTDRIDLLVTDLILPDSAGQDVAKLLTEARPDLRVLYISGYTQDFAGIEGVPRTGIEFLQKPFAADTLGLRVREILRGHPRILVVDDDPAVTRFVSQVLRQAGFEVLTAEEGKQALSIVNRQSVDLVITDLVMPVQEGLETIRALRKTMPSLAIIAMSGAFGGQYLKPALHLGARTCLAKPFTTAELLDAVHKALPTSTGAT
jgi:DNA-binding response OmpR family regulator